VDQSLECRIERDRFTVNRNDHFTLVRPHPISVALPELTEDLGVTLEQNRSNILAQLGTETLFLGVGVDRMDYTKGIVERFRQSKVFSTSVPLYREQFTFVQFGSQPDEYQALSGFCLPKWDPRRSASTGVCQNWQLETDSPF